MKIKVRKERMVTYMYLRLMEEGGGGVMFQST